MDKFKEKFDNIYEHILEARKEAQKRYIEANTILIDKEIAYTNNLFVQDDYMITEYPPMIFGMKVYYDNNLPNNANFIITQTSKNKMEQINELESELGIDLITLFNAIKQDYIYYKHYYAWDNKFKINKEYLTGLKCIDDNTIALWAGEYSGKEHIVYLKDYGTKWSLRKEDLEDEEED